MPPQEERKEEQEKGQQEEQEKEEEQEKALTKEEIEKRGRYYMPLIIECLRTKPYIEGVNEAYGLIRKDFVVLRRKAMKLRNLLNA